MRWRCKKNKQRLPLERLPLVIVALLGFSLVMTVQPKVLQAGVKDSRQELIVHVGVTRPHREDLVRKVTLQGSVAAFEQASLYAKVAGYLQWIEVDRGDWVKEGQVLALIDMPEMVPEYEQLKAEYDKYKAEYALQEIIYNRKKNLRAEEAVTEEDLDIARAQFETARANVDIAKAKMERVATLMEYARIKAPFDGVITERFLDPGALIQLGTTATKPSPILTMMDIEMVRIYIDVPEPDVPLIKKGILATLTVSALPGKEFSGEVVRFSTSLSPGTRTMRTEVDIPNPDHVLLPGMFGYVTLILERHNYTLTLPAECLIIEKKEKFVYTVADNKVKKVPVTTGIDTGIKVEIASGLTGEEDIILTGKGSVSEGMQVKLSRITSKLGEGKE
ncbi:MAG TPA: efflux RND transporter periplasmic adaptor subunit [Candidatus Hypogeohydataceae bacterium YC38]